MLGDRRLRDAGLCGQRAHRLLALKAQPLEDRPPRGIGERPEQQVAIERRHIS